MTTPKYCVTARNRLTGKRDVITPPLSLQKAQDAKQNFGISRSSKRPYTHPKIELYPPPWELTIKFD